MSLAKFNVAFRNPFPHDEFKNLWSRAWKPFKNKAFELEITKYAYFFFEVNIDINFKGEDHAGPRFELNIFGWTVMASLYDTRHWDYETNDWTIYDDNSNSQTSN
jgi:hypothetical protein